MFIQEIKIDGDNIIFTGNYAEFYIKESFFDKYTETLGDAIRTFGLISLRTFDSKGNPGKIETLGLPIFITLLGTDLEKKQISLVDGDSPESYYVLKFYKNSKIMSRYILPDSDNVELFLNMMLAGKIPNTIPYDKIINLWHMNLKLNNMHLGLPSVVLEMIISKIYRDKSNPDLEFAKTVGKSKKPDLLAYKAINVREVCARTSTFSAISFEDMDSMLISSLNKKGKVQLESPIEKIIKM